jgi:L-ribulokinase
MAEALFAGMDFGTESVRVVLVDRRGRTAGSAVAAYRHGQIVHGSEVSRGLFGTDLPAAFALQHPGDWLESAAEACRNALAAAGAASADRVSGIGVDFTSCTMLPCRADGAPLCHPCQDHPDGAPGALSGEPHAWPKLWKHHGALRQAQRLTEVARRRREEFLRRYGGTIGLEWLFPKVLEVIESAPRVAAAAEIWIEAGDWLVWQLAGSPAQGGVVAPEALPRSTCQAGYKALWSRRDGYPCAEYLREVHAELAAAAATKLPGRFVAPGRRAGSLCAAMSRRLGLPAGIALSAAIIDAHAGVPGAGVGEDGTLVLVMGTSGCHMLLAPRERAVAGVAGIVPDGILPGHVGYETGQAAMGDAFDLVRRLCGQADFEALRCGAEGLPPGARGLLCLDWLNGCRTPLMDGSLTGVLVGLTLDHGAADLYRAALEGSAMGLRWIVQTLREGGLDVERFVATGGLPERNPLFMRIVASVLGEPVAIHASPHGPALGAAILGALAAGGEAGGFDDVAAAVRSMAGAESALPPPRIVEPRRDWASRYEPLYRVYRRIADECARTDSPMRRLHAFSQEATGEGPR